ncbi:hypothetical protein Taro_016470 [Colocasia esculenta]|uniref:Uncharacterized protein n=2 Tax=Colocasia esculenta TaxID=4460 RepID=A0A843UKT1_COLES|nr:hypothetical protein [Colocasia esculenta]
MPGTSRDPGLGSLE